MKLFIDPGSSNDLYRKVIGGELDAAVIVEPQFSLPKTCGWATWREEPLIVLAHQDIGESDPHKILRTQPFIRYDRKQWGGRLADEYLRHCDIRPQDRYELDSLEAIAVFVDYRLGVSLLPDWAPPWPAGLNLIKIPLPKPFLMRRVRSSGIGHLLAFDLCRPSWMKHCDTRATARSPRCGLPGFPHQIPAINPPSTRKTEPLR